MSRETGAIAFVLGSWGFAACSLAFCWFTWRRAARLGRLVPPRPSPATPQQVALARLEQIDMLLAYGVGDAPSLGTKRYVDGRQ